MISPAIFVIVVGIVGANPHGWGWGQNQAQHYPHWQGRPEDYPRREYSERFDANMEQPRVKLVKGSMNDLMNMDTQWICTSQKTGDTMIIGSMDNTETIPVKPQSPQKPSPWLQQQQQPSPWSQQPQQPGAMPQQSPWPQAPQQPGSRPQAPQQPGSWPQDSQQPGSRPQIPQQPGSRPQIPQQPGLWPQDPQQPDSRPQAPQQQPGPWPQDSQQPGSRPQTPQQPGSWPQYPQQPGSPPQDSQQPVASAEQKKSEEPNKNPGFIESKPTGFPKLHEGAFDSPYTTTRDPLEEFDWAAYLKTANCSAPTPVTTTEFDGSGLIDPRINN